ncbi:YARHG domain-containing protein [uncultured Clostridium sp.]|uniref:YARHG domain-containing protein n=1 Tax=uncultured Clostridium sp. TaxID=59620 RepID=UPI00262910F9|nr:YARHG domain-containing protein [uncultured Clostridium sp.]
MNKRTIFKIGGTLLVSCLFTNAIVKTQGDEKVINKQVATYSYKDNYFIIPDSSDRYLTEYDLSGLTKDQLEIARNEIYARHGYQFQQQKMINYFNNQSWYVKSNKKVTTDDLSELEYANVVFIQRFEDEGMSNNNEIYYGDFVIPDSSYRKVTTDELKYLSNHQLAVARNEIYARNGYIFVSNEWKDFFVNEPWYTPISTSVTLNSTEEYNVARILEEEARR